MSTDKHGKIKSLAKLAADTRTPQHEREAAALALAKLIDEHGVPEAAARPAAMPFDFAEQLRKLAQDAEIARLRRELSEALTERVRWKKESEKHLRDALREQEASRAWSHKCAALEKQIESLTGSAPSEALPVVGDDGGSFDPRKPMGNRVLLDLERIAVDQINREHRGSGRRYVGHPFVDRYSSQIVDNLDELTVRFHGATEDIAELAQAIADTIRRRSGAAPRATPDDGGGFDASWMGQHFKGRW